jgi:hypothetical protein
MLPKNEENSDVSEATEECHKDLSFSSVPSDITVRCLEYRIRKYSPKMTPQRMKQVLQRFLKNMLLKANEDS